MRFTQLVAGMAVLTGSALAADLVVSIASERPVTTYAAKRIASSIFRDAGIIVEWRTPTSDADDGGVPWLHVRLAARTPANRLPGALGVASPGAACRRSITVFYDRIQLWAVQPSREPMILAYVLVHEITHALQGIAHHSEEGVMKAQWDARDRTEIFAKRLTLLAGDVELIRRGMAAVCPAPLTDRSEAGIAVHQD